MLNIYEYVGHYIEINPADVRENRTTACKPSVWLCRSLSQFMAFKHFILLCQIAVSITIIGRRIVGQWWGISLKKMPINA